MVSDDDRPRASCYSELRNLLQPDPDPAPMGARLNNHSVPTRHWLFGTDLRAIIQSDLEFRPKDNALKHRHPQGWKPDTGSRGSIVARRDGFASMARADCPPEREIDRALDEVHAAVGEQSIHSVGVPAAGRDTQ